MKNKIIKALLFIIITTTSCGQQQKETAQMDAVQKFKELYKTVKHFDYEPKYQLWVWSSDCYFEININNMPTMKWFYNSGSAGNRVPITDILESGIQDITVKIHPINGQTMLSDRVKLELKVVETTADARIVDEKIVFEYKTKQNVDDYDVETFANKGIPYFETKSTFNATIPYKLTGWIESKDLSKLKLKNLTDQVTEAYLAHGALLQNNKQEKIASTLYNKEKEVAQIFYHNKEDSEDRWNSYIEDFEFKNYKIQPLENYNLVLYGNGRVVALERIGPKRRGKSPLNAKYVNEEERKKIASYPLLLHIPKNSDKLEPIR